MITTTLDGTYRVSCTELDCPRPLMREVSTSAHAANLERKHIREHHTAAGDTDQVAELAEVLREAFVYGRSGVEDQFTMQAQAVIAAGYVRPPM